VSSNRGKHRIGVNLLYLREQEVGGSEVYVRELISEMARDASLELVFFCHPMIASTFSGYGTCVPLGKLSSSNTAQWRLLVESTLLPHHARHAVDVLWSPGNYLAAFAPTCIPQVCTIHDLQHRAHREYFSLNKFLQREAMFRLSILRARKIIAISGFTRNELLRYYSVTATKVCVVHEGVTQHNPSTAISREKTAAKFEIQQPFFYYPASVLPHKNHSVLFRAFALFLQERNTTYELVCTGAHSAAFHDLLQTVAPSIAPRIRHLGFVSRDEVFDLMTLSRALTFPTRYEGFGLPCLEAMLCGTPVLASNIPTLQEVCDDAAIFTDPDDVLGWVDAFRRVIDRPDEVESLRRCGLARYQQFSWARAAQRTKDVLVSAIS
jgi:alpha-1,3-rhamnosyl/mannosyltransferase